VLEELQYQVYDAITETDAAKSTSTLSNMFQNVIGKAHQSMTARRRQPVNRRLYLRTTTSRYITKAVIVVYWQWLVKKLKSLSVRYVSTQKIRPRPPIYSTQLSERDLHLKRNLFIQI